MVIHPHTPGALLGPFLGGLAVRPRGLSGVIIERPVKPVVDNAEKDHHTDGGIPIVERYS